MQTFKIFEEPSSANLEAAVNDWANAHDLKIIDFKYSHTVKANGGAAYSAGVLFEPINASTVSRKSAREIELENDANTRYRDNVIRNRGMIITIAGDTGVGKTRIADVLRDFCKDVMLPFAEFTERDLGSVACPRDVILIGKSNEEMREWATRHHRVG